MNTCNHHFPNFFEIVEDFRSLVQFHVLHERASLGLAPLQYIRHFRIGIDILLLEGFQFIPQSAPTDTVYFPTIHDFPVSQCLEQHPVRMMGQGFRGFPYNFRVVRPINHFLNGNIRSVAHSCQGQTPVQGHPVALGIRILFLKIMCGTSRSHRVTGRRPVPNSKYFSD